MIKLKGSVELDLNLEKSRAKDAVSRLMQCIVICLSLQSIVVLRIIASNHIFYGCNTFSSNVSHLNKFSNVCRAVIIHISQIDFYIYYLHLILAEMCVNNCNCIQTDFV